MSSEHVAEERPVWAALFVEGDPASWQSTLTSLRTSAPEVHIALGARGLGELAELSGLADALVEVPGAAALIERLVAEHACHVLVILGPTVFPSGALDRAHRAARELRSSSVSFLCTASAWQSFGAIDAASIEQLDGLEPDVATGRLRALGEGLEVLPTAVPLGPAVLLTAQGLSLVGSFPDHADRLALSVADYGGAARCRGMLDLLDPSTVLGVPDGAPSHGLTPAEVEWLDARYCGLASIRHAPGERSSALNEVLAFVRSTLCGLRLLVDGTCLMPEEMGHQVTFLAQLRALAERDDVAYLGVVLNGPPPPYARATLSAAKIDARITDLETLAGFPEVDVVYRPFQVTAGLDLSRWRDVGRRTVVTIHDVIGYQIPTYHGSADGWLAHRRSTRRSTAQVDGIVVISEDTRRQVHLERLGIDDSRVFLAPNGVGHLTGDERAVEPAVLLERDFAAERFVLVLGTDYTHKNRDRAIAAVRVLRERGHELSLVMAGAHVGAGSSRDDEVAQSAAAPFVQVFPDVTSEERNWLLRHASVVLYPTAAEGFGLVPHEAAAFGTPCVLVPIPALAERLSALPVLAADWSAEALADACERLLGDPDLAARQVRLTNDHLAEFSWEANVEALVSAFRSLMGRPAIATL